MNRLGKPKGPRFWRLTKIWFLLIVGLIFLPATAWSSEATLRVAFVFNFMKFIQWPNHDESSTLTLCALQTDDETRNALDQLKDKTANKHYIQLKYLNDNAQITEQLDSCNLVYQPSYATQFAIPDPLPKGVILVADEPTDYAPNISISLIRNNQGRIEFAINNNAINHAGVTVSSQLLKLAKNSHRGTTNDY